ncbi:MAG: hypothetical protein U0414_26770 [Polyangiaceae bacterium]
MRRSRSSFDLSDAIVAAESLSPKPPPAELPKNDFGGVPLVAFERPSVVEGGPPSIAQRRQLGRLAAPPETSGTVANRCDKLLEWLRADPHTLSVLLVDADGLPISKEGSKDEALLGATANVAYAIRQLALASPGSVSREFESHVGDGPVLSLIGFMVGAKLYIVGISHQRALDEHDTARIRAAFTLALTPLHRPGDRSGERAE